MSISFPYQKKLIEEGELVEREKEGLDRILRLSQESTPGVG